jgi:hypothetical protein
MSAKIRNKYLFGPKYISAGPNKYLFTTFADVWEDAFRTKRVLKIIGPTLIGARPQTDMAATTFISKTAD